MAAVSMAAGDACDLKKLYEAVASGDSQLASTLAADMAKANREAQGGIDKSKTEDYIALLVTIEDSEASGATMKLKVKPSYSIADLKYLLMFLYKFPVETQNWIVGRRIAPDNRTLASLKVTQSGQRVFVYLKRPREFRMTPEGFEEYRTSQLRRNIQSLRQQEEAPPAQSPPTPPRADGPGPSHLPSSVIPPRRAADPTPRQTANPAHGQTSAMYFHEGPPSPILPLDDSNVILEGNSDSDMEEESNVSLNESAQQRELLRQAAGQSPLRGAEGGAYGGRQARSHPLWGRQGSENLGQQQRDHGTPPLVQRANTEVRRRGRGWDDEEPQQPSRSGTLGAAAAFHPPQGAPGPSRPQKTRAEAPPEAGMFGGVIDRRNLGPQPIIAHPSSYNSAGSNSGRHDDDDSIVRSSQEDVLVHPGATRTDNIRQDTSALFEDAQPRFEPMEDSPPGPRWACPTCTYLNLPRRPGCEMCATARPSDYVIPDGVPEYTPQELARLQEVQHNEVLARRMEEELQRKRMALAKARDELARKQAAIQNMKEMVNAASQRGCVPNSEEFTCQICFADVEPGEGAVLRECLHQFCRDCLGALVKHCEESQVTCPYRDEAYQCAAVLLDMEVQDLVSPEQFGIYLRRGLQTAESRAPDSFHCRTQDCQGWCFYEEEVNFFWCPMCKRRNCLTCKAIHDDQNCKEYQDDLKIRALNDKTAKATQDQLEKMIRDGEAMHCPQCKIVVTKKSGCDWLQCSVCKTEICWVRKMRRWGPKGRGDISGGCRCRVNGEACAPNCGNCH